MTKNDLGESPLAHLRLPARTRAAPVDVAVTLCERAFRGQFVLRGDAADQMFTAAVEQAVGASLPTVPNTANRNGERAILWLGPDEWLLVVPEGSKEDTLSALTRELVGRHHAVTDTSDGRAIIGLAGARARDVLMKGCSLDLHQRKFTAGQCAQTRLARCQMLLHQIKADPVYDIYVQRSFADYVWRWLEDAAAEYGVAVVE